MTAPENSLTKLIGMHIRGLRRQAKLSQEEFADRCGLHPNYIGTLERGEQTASIEVIKKITDGLDLRLSGFFLEMGE